MYTEKSIAGFTLIELLLVMGITILLAGIATVNLIRPQQKANLDSALDALVGDLRTQQLNSIAGKSNSNFGIYFQPTQYTLFKGTYTVGASGNVIVKTPGVSLSTNFAGSQVMFSSDSGEVVSFVSGSNTITLTSGSQSRNISVNRYGVPRLQ